MQFTADPAWFVVKTNPRCEERAASRLDSQGFHVHLPRGVKLVRRRHLRKPEPVQFPLLTGYLFVGLSAYTPAFYHLRQTDGVHSVLGRQQVEIGQEAKTRYVTVPGRVVAEFIKLETEGRFDQTRIPEPAPRIFSPGDGVTIDKGPLAGVKLVFDDYFGKSSARVLAEIFGNLRPIVVEDVDILSRAA